MSSRSVLLIGYTYPPGGGVGSIRIAKAAKYLPDSWDIHVVTSPQNSDLDQDHQIDIPDDVTIHEVAEWWSSAPKDFDKLRWSPPLTTTVYRLHRTYDFDCIWHTVDPFLPLTAAPLIRRLTNIPYVIDLRDPWKLRPTPTERTPFGKLYDLISRGTEPFVLQTADSITTATKGLTDMYKTAYPDIGEKIHTIRNGYDPDDFEVEDTTSLDEFQIVYPGKITPGMDCEPFFRAVSEIRKSHDVSILHIGHSNDHVQNLAKEVGISNLYTNTGYLDRKSLAKHVHRASVGLALTRDSVQIPTKVYDYIACDTPILGCGPTDGSMAEITDKFEYAWTVPNEVTAITEILEMIAVERPDTLGSGPRSNYTRQRTADQLVDVFEDVIDTGPNLRS
ncbi:glycosyltransferase [Haloplanus rubicundus]|uniref:Glycosyltransferase n=1 Tax=Haloplanus rubicundus TaxID=1547898 RepID=A0A345E280_9EURY|nr:glycosyltransferase [Haloplanus rubicundus]AXG06302.1 glycosyltransferase [Haloplanus rubicundus]